MKTKISTKKDGREYQFSLKYPMDEACFQKKILSALSGLRPLAQEHLIIEYVHPLDQGLSLIDVQKNSDADDSYDGTLFFAGDDGPCLFKRGGLSQAQTELVLRCFAVGGTAPDLQGWESFPVIFPEQDSLKKTPLRPNDGEKDRDAPRRKQKQQKEPQSITLQELRAAASSTNANELRHALSLSCTGPDREVRALRVRCLKTLADQGDAQACIMLGLSYQGGVGVRRNCKKALEFYQKAAELGDPRGDDFIGMVYFEGIGVPVSYMEAYSRFTRHGMPQTTPALYALGEICRLGLGIEPDEDRALECYTRLIQMQGAPTNPYLPCAVYQAGLIYANRTEGVRDLQQAISHLQSALSLLKEDFRIDTFAGVSVQDVQEQLNALMERAKLRGMFHLLHFDTAMSLKEFNDTILPLLSELDNRPDEELRLFFDNRKDGLAALVSRMLDDGRYAILLFLEPQSPLLPELLPQDEPPQESLSALRCTDMTLDELRDTMIEITVRQKVPTNCSWIFVPAPGEDDEFDNGVNDAFDFEDGIFEPDIYPEDEEELPLS